MARGWNRPIHTNLLMVLVGLVLVIAGLVFIGWLTFAVAFANWIIGLVLLAAGIITMLGAWSSIK